MNRAAALLAVALVGLAGCGGGDGPANNPANDAATERAPSAAATSLVGGAAAGGANAPILPCTGLDSPFEGAAKVGTGRALPELTLDCLGGGPAVTLRDLRGPMVLNVWASWCKPCRAELPFLKAAHAAAGDRVRFAALAFEDNDAPAREWVAFHGVPWPSLTDRKGASQGPLRVPGPPVTLFVNSAGSIVGVHYGQFTSAAQVQDAIAEHLGVS